LSIAGNGYNYQIEEVNRCLREGKTESTIMALDETLSIMRTLDDIRFQWGLKYPME
jgi:dihydrodiol dehydrogenase / D-xylose 1-dehydrogenase (NADP)